MQQKMGFTTEHVSFVWREWSAFTITETLNEWAVKKKEKKGTTPEN